MCRFVTTRTTLIRTEYIIIIDRVGEKKRKKLSRVLVDWNSQVARESRQLITITSL